MARKRMISAGIKYTLFERFKGICSYCKNKIKVSYHNNGVPMLAYGHGRSPFHIDHILPESKGGLTILSNLTLSCSKCNMKKDKRIWLEKE